MSDLQTIIRRPLVTEKSTRQREEGQFVIEVDPRASKAQVKQVLKEQFKVDVLAIQTVKLPGKFRRRTGPQGGYQSDRKKAIVKLKQGQQITWEEPK